MTAPKVKNDYTINRLVGMVRLKNHTLSDERVMSDEEISNAVKNIFSSADYLEVWYHQVIEIRDNLRVAFKAQGIDEKEIIKRS